METVKLTIDNKQVEVQKGATILNAAHQLGIDIPTLCHMKLDDLNIENKPGRMQNLCRGSAGTQKPFSRMHHKMRRGSGCPYTYPQGHECPQDSYGVHSLGSSERLSHMPEVGYTATCRTWLTGLASGRYPDRILQRCQPTARTSLLPSSVSLTSASCAADAR